MPKTKPNDNLQSIIAADYLREDELARELGTSTRSLKRWNSLRIGPPRIVVGRKIFYRRVAVQEWLRSFEERGEGRNRRRRVAA